MTTEIVLGYSAKFIENGLSDVTPPTFPTVTEIPEEAYIFEVARSMSRELVGDHTHVLRTYTNVFIGSRAVKWMLTENVVDTEKEALVIGNRMLRAGLIHHVFNHHPFENKHLFYR
eukprot:2158895-Pyramimonas_sp.AAC.1